MKKLTKEEILLLHSELIYAHGGGDGIRDETLLDSAIAAPFQAFGGQSMFPSIQQKAVRLGFGLIMNHPFIDGNKRVGAHVMLTMLAMNSGMESTAMDRWINEIKAIMEKARKALQCQSLIRVLAVRI